MLHDASPLTPRTLRSRRPSPSRGEGNGGRRYAAALLGAMMLVALNTYASEEYEKITQKEIDAIKYDDAEEDAGFVAPLVGDLKHLEGERLKAYNKLLGKLDEWEGGKDDAIGQKVRNYLCLSSLMDLTRGEFEAELPYSIFEKLKNDVPRDKLVKAVAWVILKPNDGVAVTEAKDLGIREAAEETVRERTVLYAKKLLGRLMGKLPAKKK